MGGREGQRKDLPDGGQGTAEAPGEELHEELGVPSSVEPL